MRKREEFIYGIQVALGILSLLISVACVIISCIVRRYYDGSGFIWFIAACSIVIIDVVVFSVIDDVVFFRLS